MTDRVHPTQGEASSHLTSGAIKWAASGDWIVPSGSDYLASFAGLKGSPLNGFEESHSNGLTVTIATGEAFVGGRWCARDVPTDVSLAASTSGQRIYIGWTASEANSISIGLDTDVPADTTHRRTSLWEFDTDDSGVTSVRKVHDTEPIHPRAETAESLVGVSADRYVRRDRDETISGAWNFNSSIGMNNNSISNISSLNSSGLQLDDGGNGLRMSASPNGRPFIAPYLDGSPDYSRELTFDRSLSRWAAEGGFDVRSGPLNIHRTHGHMHLVESGNDDKEWRIEAQSGDFRVVEPGVEEWLRIDSAQGNRLEAPGGMATQQLRLLPQTSPPDSPQNGMLAIQDGNQWNPAGTGNLDLVVYLGGSWERAT